MDKKNFELYLPSNPKAKLADKRTRIERDNGAPKPHEHMEMLFRIESDAYDCDVSASMLKGIEKDQTDWCFDGTVRGEDGRTYTVRTSDERVTRLCGDDPKYHTIEWLATQVKAEVEIVEHYVAGRVYGFVTEEWRPEDREWETIDSLWGMYGPDEVLGQIEEMGLDVDPVCAPTDIKWEFPKWTWTEGQE